MLLYQFRFLIKYYYGGIIMVELNLRPREECAFDAASIGEVMLRLDPGDVRIRTARQFKAWEGGVE